MLSVAPSEQTPADDTAAVRKSPRRHILGSIAVWLVPALVTFGVGWWGMLSVGISRDETASLDISTRTLPQIWRMIQHADEVHALYYLILHFWTEAFGTTLLTIRLPSLIGTAIAAAVVAVLGRMLISARAGLTAGLLFACAPEVSYYAHDARSYGMDLALVVAMVIVFVHAMRSPRRRTWIWYGLMLLLTVVMHLFTLLIVPAQGITIIWYAISQRSWRPVVRWFASVVVALGALTPFILRAIDQGSTANWIPKLAWSEVSEFATELSGGTYLTGAVIVLIAFAVFGTRRPAGPAGTPTVLNIALPWLVLPPILLFVGSIWDPLYVFRYLLYTLPALVLLMAAGLDRLGRWWLHAIVLLALIALTIPLHRAVRNPDQGANDFRSEATYISRNKDPGDAIVFLVPTQRQLATSDRRAYSGLRDIARAKTSAQAANFSGTDVPDAVLEQHLKTVNRVWAVKYWVAAAGRPAAHAVEARRYALFKSAGLRWVDTQHFRGGAILLFVRPGTRDPEPRFHAGVVGG